MDGFQNRTQGHCVVYFFNFFNLFLLRSHNSQLILNFIIHPLLECSNIVKFHNVEQMLLIYII